MEWLAMVAVRFRFGEPSDNVAQLSKLIALRAGRWTLDLISNFVFPRDQHGRP